MGGVRTFATVDSVKELLKNNSEVEISDLTISEWLVLRATDEINCTGIVFTNCSFSKILFNKVELNIGIKFIDCEVSGNLIFVDSSIKGYVQDFNLHNCSLEFHKLKVLGAFQMKNVNLDRGIVFRDSCELEKMIISDVKLLNGGINFEKSSIHGICDIANVNLTEFRFEECEVNSQIRLSNIFCSGLCFLQSKFKRDIYIWGGAVKDHLTFNDGIFEDDVVIQAVKSSGALTVIGSEFKTELNVLYNDNTSKITGGCKKIYISNFSVDSRISFIGSEDIAELYALDEVTIYASEKLKGEINFRNFVIDKVLLKGNNINGKIRFSHVNFQNLKLDEFTNASKVQFYDVKSKDELQSSLEVYKSNLGVSEFYNVDLNSFKKITIKTSILSEIIASNVTWFRKEQLHPEAGISKELMEIEWRNNREVFRQLKYSMEKQGNKIQSLDFKSYEMESYKQELLQQSLSNENAGNKFILWLNQSNDYGLNFLKPLFYIFVFTIIFYCLIVVGISEKLCFSLGGGCEDIKSTIKEFKSYSCGLPKMLNPIYDFSKAFPSTKDKTDISFWVSFIDFLYRILLSYLIFQLISAFRKFVK